MMKKICILMILFLLCFAVEAKEKDKDKKYRGIDTDPPTGTIQIIPPIKGEYLDFTVSFTDPAPGIGMGSYCISNDEVCTAWTPYTGPATIHWLMLTGTGLRTIYVYGKDLLGHIGLSKIMVIKQ